MSTLTIAAVDDPEARSILCRDIMTALPRWFGDVAAREKMVTEAAQLETYAARLETDAAQVPKLVGVVALNVHFGTTVEVDLLAVLEPFHRRGIGRALVAKVESVALALGAKLLSVKTLGPSRADDAFAATRTFYEALGFFPVEEFEGLWPGHPTLLLVKPLAVQ